MIIIKSLKGQLGLLHYSNAIAWEGAEGHGPIVSSGKLTKGHLAKLYPLTPQVAQGARGVSSGSDPEVFIARGNGEVFPAWEFLQAKKEHAAVDQTFWDGVQAEMSFARGYHCHQELTGAVRYSLNEILCAAKIKDPKASLALADCVTVPEAILQGVAEEYVALGCAPSTNPYGIEPIYIDNPRKHSLRYSGTHMHFSTSEATPAWFPEGTAVMMDKVAGVLLTALGRSWDNPERRKAYGRPGECRVPQPGAEGYRIEYRTPGSFLLRSPQLFSFSMDIGRVAFKLGHLFDGRKFPLPEASGLILACDADAAVKYIAAHQAFFDKVLVYCGGGYVKQANKLLAVGAKASGLFSEKPEYAWEILGKSYLPEPIHLPRYEQGSCKILAPPKSDVLCAGKAIDKSSLAAQPPLRQQSKQLSFGELRGKTYQATSVALT